MKRREVLLGLGAMWAAGLIQGCATSLREDAMGKDEMSVETVRTSTGVTIHAIQTGWVSVKELHRELSGPESLRMARIIFGGRWTSWLPILCWVIEHPEGLIVVDAGETAKTKDPVYFECDKPSRFVYERILRLNVEERWEIGPQMIGLGLDPRDVKYVVSTHLHSDHMGGLYYFPRSEFITSRDYHDATGTLPCRYPDFFKPQIATYDTSSALTGFDGAMPLTTSGDVLLLPTPGHSVAHQSVAVRTPERTYVLAGDATFDERQLRDDKIAGISERPALARDTLGRLRALCESTPVVYMPSHDPESMTRLVRGQVYSSSS